MKLIDVISGIDNAHHGAVIYAKRMNGKFYPDSEAVVLELTEEELEWKWTEVSAQKCPGYDYFLEVFIVHEFSEGVSWNSLTEKCNRIIYYAENDA
ncbi:MAG: hypothetical protein GC178_13440 [Flavobacteriales bacterium]|nr:hypothetical protein [Flavobacteriales bacterium]